MKKIVLCCLIVVIFCGCECVVAPYNCTLSVLNTTNYTLEIISNKDACYIDSISPNETCVLVLEYEFETHENMIMPFRLFSVTYMMIQYL